MHTARMEYENITHCQDKSRTHSIHNKSQQDWLTDVGEEHGGLGLMPDPACMLAATAASCMASMMSVICANNKAMSTGIRVESSPVKGDTGITGINFRISLPKQLSELSKKLEQGVLHCPVKKALSSDVTINIEWNWE